MIKRSLNINLKPLLKKLEIESKKHLAGVGGIVGEHQSYFKGSGMDFAGYRTYTIADDATKIDWRASLRAGETLIKEYMEERNLNIFFLIDSTDSMINGTAVKLKCEYAAEVATNLAYLGLNSQHNMGYLMFNHKVVAWQTPRRGNKQLFVMSRDLSDPNHYGGKLNLKDPVQLTMATLSPGSIVIMISDFLNMPPGWEHIVSLLSSKYDMIFVMIRDKIDYELPSAGDFLISDVGSDQQLLVDSAKVREKYRAEAMANHYRVFQTIKNAGGDLLVLHTDEPYVNKIKKFFRRRKV